MGVVIKQAVRSTVYSYIGALLGFLTVWFMNRLWLTSEQNGLLNILISFSLITGSLANLGMSGVITRMFPNFRDHNNKHSGFLFYPVIITVVGFVIFLIVFLTFQDELVARNIAKSRLFAENVIYIIPLTFFLGMFYILDAFSRSIFLSTTGVIIKEVLLRIVILIGAYLYHIGIIEFDAFVLIYCSSFCSIALVLALYLFVKNEFHITKPQKLSKDVKYEIRQVAFFSIITGLSSLLINSIDKFIVNDKLGLAAAGVFSIATYFGSIIQIPARSISRITSSVIADSWKQNNLENIKSVYHKSCLNQLIIGLGIFLAILVNIENIISLMPPDYSEAGYVIIFIALGYLIDMATGVNGVIISTSKYFRYDSLFMFLLVMVTIATNLFFIPMYGITGAAIASCVTFFLYNMLRYLFIWYKFQLQPYDLDFVKVLLIGGISYFVANIVPSIVNNYLDAISRGMIFMISYSAMIYFTKVAPDINKTIQNTIKK